MSELVTVISAETVVTNKLLIWRQICPTTGIDLSSAVCLDAVSLSCVRSTDSSWEPRSTPHWTDPTFTYRLMREQQRRWRLWVWTGRTSGPLAGIHRSWRGRNGAENSSILQVVCCSSKEAQYLESLWFEEEEVHSDVALSNTLPVQGTLFYNWSSVDLGGWVFQGSQRFKGLKNMLGIMSIYSLKLKDSSCQWENKCCFLIIRLHYHNWIDEFGKNGYLAD